MRLFSLVEPVEHIRKVLCRDTNALVFYRNAYVPFAGFCFERQRSARRRKFNCIINQVSHNLRNLIRIRFHRRMLRKFSNRPDRSKQK